MAAKSFFVALFLPNGYPSSVAPEYGRYQLWDTVQQVTFFVNTVISKQAMMKFHGVGDPDRTPAEATALELGRDLLAQLVSLLITTPAMTRVYKAHVYSFRMLSEILNAVGHFLEVLAGIFSGVVALLYGGPLVCCLSGSVGGAVRSVILQHFGLGGSLPAGQQPSFGDISLKESNQDKGGKIVGLILGITLLAAVGASGTSEQAIDDSIKRSLYVFAALSVVHICGNVLAVQQLRLPQEESSTPGGSSRADGRPASGPEAEPAQAQAQAQAKAKAKHKQADGFLRKMFLPPGYPHTVVEQYTKYQMFSRLASLTMYPKRVVVSMAFWAYVYGVGDSQKTPMDAVAIDIFTASIDCVVSLLSGLPAITQRFNYGAISQVSLLSGLPAITQRFNYGAKVWQIRAALLGLLSEVLQLLAALAPPAFLYPLLVVARIASAFGSTSGSVINGSIPYNMIAPQYRGSKEIELIHLSVTDGNQTKLCRLPTGVLSIAFLHYAVHTNSQPSLPTLLGVYALLQTICLVSCLGKFYHTPPLEDLTPKLPTQCPEPVTLLDRSETEPSPTSQPLLASPPQLRRHSSEPWQGLGGTEWAVQNDRESEVDNCVPGLAGTRLSQRRSL